MKFFLLTWISKLVNYLKTRNRSSLLAASIAFIPGVVLTVFAFYQIMLPINEYFANGMPWDRSFNGLIVNALLNAILFLPALAMFICAYLEAESNTLGFKISFALSIGLLISLIFNFGNQYLLLFCMISYILATLFGYEVARKNQNKGYSPIVVEKVAILGLRLAALISIIVLAGLVSYVGIRGAENISWEFITGDSLIPREIAERIVQGESIGGIRIFIIGSLIIVGYCELIAIPIGIGAAIYLSEYAPKSKFVESLRFFIETLAGAPSVLIGLFGLIYFVKYAGMGFSTAAAGLALAFMILPWNIRVAEEAMRAVPQAYREASYALGATKWQTIRKVVLLPASPGSITGILLGFGKAIGETAVLLFTAGALGVFALPNHLSIPFGGTDQAMPVLSNWILGAFIYVHHNFGGDIKVTESHVWQMSNVAYSGALVLLGIFFAISIGAIILRNYLAKKTRGA
ncbi:MAG: phosphate ABC transporter permease PstA [Candidatus Bathyarchaeia archaeon]|jgi:phosphate transport system permease protein